MNDDDDLDAKDREFQPKGRNYQKRGAKKRARKSGSVGPKKPVFEYARILELPADILCNILSHLPLDNRESEGTRATRRRSLLVIRQAYTNSSSNMKVYTLSISHRKFTSFLHSKASAGIWRDARKRLTVYGKLRMPSICT